MLTGTLADNFFLKRIYAKTGIFQVRGIADVLCAENLSSEYTNAAVGKNSLDFLIGKSAVLLLHEVNDTVFADGKSASVIIKCFDDFPARRSGILIGLTIFRVTALHNFPAGQVTHHRHTVNAPPINLSK